MIATVAAQAVPTSNKNQAKSVRRRKGEDSEFILGYILNTDRWSVSVDHFEQVTIYVKYFRVPFSPFEMSRTVNPVGSKIEQQYEYCRFLNCEHIVVANLSFQILLVHIFCMFIPIHDIAFFSFASISVL